MAVSSSPIHHQEGVRRVDIANQVGLTIDELNNLVFGLVITQLDPGE